MNNYNYVIHKRWLTKDQRLTTPVKLEQNLPSLLQASRTAQMYAVTHQHFYPHAMNRFFIGPYCLYFVFNWFLKF